MIMSTNIPTEILTEILTYLPTKILLTLKTLSKSHYTLLKSPSFIHCHLSRTRTRHLIISTTTLSTSPLHLTPFTFSQLNHPLKKPENPQKTLNYFPQPNGLLLLGHCNGVITVANAVKTSVYLYSPSTRTDHCVRPSHIMYPDGYVVFGFGYDGKKDDFVLLRVVQCSESYCHVRFYNEAKVYSLRDGGWRWVEDLPWYLVYKDCHGVFVGNALHFVVLVGEKYRIAKFDLGAGTGAWGLMDLPRFEDGVKKLVLRELGGCLSVMVNYRSGFGADLWVLKGGSWGRVLSVETSPRFSEVRPVVFSDDERRVLLLIDNCELQWCELGNGDERVRIERSRPLLDECFDAEVYVESLISLDDWRSDLQGKHKKNFLRADLDDFLSVGFKLKL